MVKLPTRQTSLREAVLWVISQLAAGSPKSIEAYVNDLTLKHGEDARFWALDLAERYWRGLQHDKKVADWECRKILGTPAERDNAYADAAVAKVAGIATTADLWRAVDAMMDRRATMTISASQRISDAIHRRYEQLTGRTISGAPVAKDAA